MKQSRLGIAQHAVHSTRDGAHPFDFVPHLPLLVGISRKSMLGAVTGRAVNERLIAGVAAAVMAVERGARIVRVHDVAETVDALKIWQAVMDADTAEN